MLYSRRDAANDISRFLWQRLAAASHRFELVLRESELSLMQPPEFLKRRDCAHCGQPFQQINPIQRHCSLTCRFWSRVSIGDVDDCWPWTGALQKQGYGIIGYNGTTWLTHRIAWLLDTGDLAEPCVLHHCDNPPCANPRHLFAGTNHDNVLDREAKGRGGGPKCRGVLSGRAVLIEAQIPEIRALILAGVSFPKIGARFGVTKGAICSIANGRSWHYVQ